MAKELLSEGRLRVTQPMCLVGRGFTGCGKIAFLSSRARRGICFFADPEQKADSSGKPRPRKDTFLYFFRGLFSRDVQAPGIIGH